MEPFLDHMMTGYEKWILYKHVVLEKSIYLLRGDTTIHIQSWRVSEEGYVVLLGLGSNLGEDMGVCKCIVPARHGCTLNNRRAASPLVRLVEGEERWEASDHPQSVLSLNWGWNRAKPYLHLSGVQSYG
ncbi:uncharacterized protein TNCV_1367531 [Trichonephila clavipes]|nr:uncharacterized protein TNCV_1367531 [Trichonephila clavipes]